MKIYLISDTHFNHKKICEYANRPFSSVEEMNKTLIKNWNAVINSDDLVIHLGDVALGSRDGAKKILSQLKGRKILIKGNHDNWTDSFYKECGFEYVSKYPICWGENYILSHSPLKYDSGEYINIFGHVHNKVAGVEKSGKSKCICVEQINYTPIEFYKLEAIIRGEQDEKNG